MFLQRTALKASLMWGVAFFVAFFTLISAQQAHAATVGDVVISYQILDAGTTRKGLSSGVVTLNTEGASVQGYYNFFTPGFDYSTYQLYLSYSRGDFVFFPHQEGKSGIYRLLSSGDRVPEKGSSSFNRYDTKVVKGADYIIYDDETDSLIKVHVNDLVNSVPWGTAPRIPRQASRSVIYPRAVDFYWYGVEGAQSYDVEFGCGSCVSGGFETPRYFITSKPFYSFNHTLITADGDYRFAVRARNSSGSYGPWSEYQTLSFEVNSDNDGTVNIATSESSPDKNGKVAITFTVTVSGAKKTKSTAVYVDNKYAKYCSTLPCVYTTDFIYKKGDVVPYAARTTHEDDYKYSFSGDKQLIVSGGTSNVSGAVRFAPEITSPEPNKVLTNFPRFATLKWKTLEGASKYEIEIACDTCGSSVKFGQPESYSTTETSYVTGSLAGDNEFRFRVRGMFGNPSEPGPWSEYRYFKYRTSSASVDTTKNTKTNTSKIRIKPRKYPEINVTYTKVAAGDDGNGGFSTDDYYKVTVTSVDGAPIKTIEIYGASSFPIKCKNKTSCGSTVFVKDFLSKKNVEEVLVRAYDRVTYPTIKTIELSPGGSACKDEAVNLESSSGSQGIYVMCVGDTFKDSGDSGIKMTVQNADAKKVTFSTQNLAKKSIVVNAGTSFHAIAADETSILKLTYNGLADGKRAVFEVKARDYNLKPEFKAMKADERASIRFLTGLNDVDLVRLVDVGVISEALGLYKEIHGSYPITTKPLVLGVKGAQCFNAEGFGATGCADPYLKAVPASAGKYPFVYESKDGTTFEITFRFDKGSKKQFFPGAEAESVSTPKGIYDKKKGPPTFEEILKSIGESPPSLGSPLF